MDDEEEISLEDLGRTYQQMFAPEGSDLDSVSDSSSSEQFDSSDYDEDVAEAIPIAITPESIVEAVLFVGHPRNRGVTASQLASMMRGVNDDDIPAIVDRLNERYESNRNALRIEMYDGEYSMSLDPSMKHVKGAFAGKVSPFKLNQQAIDCLALIAYRPGATMEEIEALWNRPPGSIVRMLIRRNLVELRREGKGKSLVERYYPADRFFEVLGIDTLDDLPRVE